MHIVKPMFLMDENNRWYWYIISSEGVLVAISARSFGTFAEVRRDFDKPHSWPLPFVA